MSERVVELMRQARWMREGPEQVAVLEEAVREADVLNDVPLGYDARMELIRAGIFGGFSERAIVAFSWCLARFDESPDEFDEFDLFWKYKWIINNVSNYPTVSRQKIAEMQDDMERRFIESGYSLRPVHYFRADNAIKMGDPGEAWKHFQKWRGARRDWLADCGACEQSNTVWMLAQFGRNDEALEAAEPILSGNMSCTAVPHSTYGYLVHPLLRLGRLDEALVVYRKGYRLISRNPTYLIEISEHMLTLLAADDLKKAVRLFERHLPWAVETMDLDARFRFYNSSALFLEKLAENSQRKRKLTLPPQLPCCEQESKYDPAELARWFAKETQALADQFNRRNGNEYYNELIAESCELVGLG